MVPSPDPIREEGKDIVGAFDHPVIQKSMEVNLKVIATYDVLLEDLEQSILKLAKDHDPVSYTLLQSTDMKECLTPTFFINSDHPALQEKSKVLTPSPHSAKKRAIASSTS